MRLPYKKCWTESKKMAINLPVESPLDNKDWRVNMELADTVNKETVSDFHMEKIRVIDLHNFEPVKKKLKKDAAKSGVHLSDAEVERGVLSLKQYYAIALLDPLNEHAVSDKVDVYWHTHMLFSEEYSSMCQEVVGGFMHHRPLDHEDKEELQKVRQLYGYTQECYRKFFNLLDTDFNPSEVEDERLICTHFGSSVQNPRYGLDVIANALLPKQQFASA
jgi:hypothetical protein